MIDQREFVQRYVLLKIGDDLSLSHVSQIVREAYRLYDSIDSGIREHHERKEDLRRGFGE